MNISLRRFLAFLGLAFALSLALAGSASAADGVGGTTYTPNLATVIGLLVSVVIPAAVALVSKVTFRGKGYVLLLFVAITAVATNLASALANNQPFDWRTVVFTAAVNFIIAALAYAHIWKGTDAQAKLLLVGDRGTDSTAHAGR